MHDHAGHAFVSHQDIGAAPQQPNRQALVAATAHQRLELVDRAGLGEILRRSAQLKPRVRRERLSLLYEMFETLCQGHARPL